jgi:PAS domain S-box-containing protein
MASLSSEQLRAMRERMLSLTTRARDLTPPRADDLEATLRDMSRVLEELRAADEELRLQNERLLRAQEELEVQRRRYQNLFEFAPDGYLLTDFHGTIQEANRAAAMLLNIPAASLQGRALAMFTVRESRADLYALLNRLRRQSASDPVSWEARLLPHQREPLEASLTASVVRDREEKLIGLGWLVRDLKTLKQAQQRALEGERLAAISQMITGLAHESRNALQRSSSCLEMLALELRDRPRGLELIERLQKAQSHLHRLYEEVRQFASPIRLDRQLCRLSNIWREAWAQLENQRRDRQAVLRDSGLRDDWCAVDRFRLEQVFRHVLENALAACSDPVEIAIACTRVDVDHKSHVQIVVRDNGPGFTAEQRDKAFEPFYTTKLHSTGLGLTVARRFVEAHGGSITASAKAAPGAEIIILLPIQH